MSKDRKKKRGTPYYTSKEAARFLRIKPGTLDNWRWKGIGPDFRKHGRTVVYTEPDLIAFSESRDDKRA